jgi:hypothetical protein
VEDSITAIQTTDVQILAEASAFDRSSQARDQFMKTGRLSLRIISPGWGTSGYYGTEVLEEAAGNGIFPAGTKMYWDHPTITEAATRPERSLRDLAAVFVESARWDPNGAKGPGLYTTVKVFNPYREAVWDMAPHIGPSIRAVGPVKFGEAEGKKGPLVEGIIAAQSVDFVTAPGRGGEILQLFEAARPAATSPITPTTGSDDNRETDAVELQEATRQLGEAQGQVRTLTEANQTLTTERDDARNELARLQEASILRDARDFVAEALSKVPQLPEMTKQRLLVRASQNPPTKDGQLDKLQLQESLKTAIQDEVKYLSEVAKIKLGGRPEGVGGETSGIGDPEGNPVDLSESFISAWTMTA